MEVLYRVEDAGVVDSVVVVVPADEDVVAVDNVVTYLRVIIRRARTNLVVKIFHGKLLAVVVVVRHVFISFFKPELRGKFLLGIE